MRGVQVRDRRKFPYKIREMRAYAWAKLERDGCQRHAVKVEHDSASAVLWRKAAIHRDAVNGRQAAQRRELCRLLESLAAGAGLAPSTYTATLPSHCVTQTVSFHVRRERVEEVPVIAPHVEDRRGSATR